MHPTRLRIATVTCNPAIDHTVGFDHFQVGEVNRVAWEQCLAGGKGLNVASFLADAGLPVTATGFLGTENPARLEAHLKEKQIRDAFVRVPGATRTNLKLVCEQARAVTDINFAGLTVLEEDITQLDRQLDALAQDHEWFVLCGSLPGGLSPQFFRRLVERLQAAGRKVVVDLNGPALQAAVSAHPFAAKPNAAELALHVGQPLPTEEDCLAAAREVQRQGIPWVVVSRGAAGAVFVTADAAVAAQPPAHVVVRSTVGAGDAMVAGLLTAWTQGLSLRDTARLATAFSLAALSRMERSLPLPDELERLTATVSVRPL